MHLERVFPVGLDVNWQPAHDAKITDHYLRNWLLDTGSLTERVQSLCRNFSLRRLGQGSAPLSQNEQHCLNAAQADYEVREVLLLADEIPWVFARSIVPLALSQGEWQSLGNQPLGKLLFNDKRFSRSTFEIAQIADNLLSSLPIPSVNHPLFGRRSLFSMQGNKVLVAEVFLPQSPVYMGYRP